MTAQTTLGCVEKSIELPKNLAVAQLFSQLTKGRKHQVLFESREINTGIAKASRMMLSAAFEVVCSGLKVEITVCEESDEKDAQLKWLTEIISRVIQAGKPAQIDCVEIKNADKPGFRLTFPSPSIAMDEDKRLRFVSTLQVLRELASETDMQSCLYGGFAFDFLETFELVSPVGPASAGEDFPDYWFFVAQDEILIDPEENRLTINCRYFQQDSLIKAKQKCLNIVNGINQTLTQHENSETHVGQTVIPKNSNRLGLTENHGQKTISGEIEVTPTQTIAQYCQAVRSCQEYIYSGDIYQVVPARGFRLECVDAFAAYEVLRVTNPSPYLFYLKFGAVEIIGSSPESALRVDGKTRNVAMRPIAGTQPRSLLADGSIDVEEDIRAQVRLRTDQKELSEHLMLVDLARNDLARICAPGSRQVQNLLQVEMYSKVMHLVSQVGGKLRADLDGLDAYRACMNMGTLTGAPKLRAMEILRQVEGTRRGIYGGAVGYLDCWGNFDTAIAIRCAQIVAGRAIVKAGAGVVFDSIPESEAAETFHKASAVLEAIAIAQGKSIVRQV